jgi:hypothetical protein
MWPYQMPAAISATLTRQSLASPAQRLKWLVERRASGRAIHSRGAGSFDVDIPCPSGAAETFWLLDTAVGQLLSLEAVAER